MDERDIRDLLEKFRAGRLTTAQALDRLKHLPFEDLGFAKIDHHRTLRQGYAEVIFGRGKTPTQIAAIVRSMLQVRDSRHNILITRADAKTFAEVRRIVTTSLKNNRSSSSRRAKSDSGRVVPSVTFHPLSGVITIERNPEIVGRGTIAIVSAGTSDIPVAEEALLTAKLMGNHVESFYDVGVAGIHRLLEHRTRLATARVIICVAGMEGALPSVVGGLVAAPVIAVPTSVGYGASFGGVAALLGMLNSCASNVCVVNIDNGFGAGCVASVINRL